MKMEILTIELATMPVKRISDNSTQVSTTSGSGKVYILLLLIYHMLTALGPNCPLRHKKTTTITNIYVLYNNT